MKEIFGKGFLELIDDDFCWWWHGDRLGVVGGKRELELGITQLEKVNTK